MPRQLVGGAAMQGNAGRLLQRPAQPRRREREGGGRAGKISNSSTGSLRRKRCADAEIHRIARCNENSRQPAPRHQRRQRALVAVLPEMQFDPGKLRLLQKPFRPEQRRSRFYARKRRRAQPGQPVVARADDGQPRAHAPHPMLQSAFTAAAAMALPPRLPLIAMKGTPRGLAMSSALLSAAPTKPTGKPENQAQASARHCPAVPTA